MKIEPIAWAMTDHQADGPNTQYTRLSQAAQFWAANGVEVEPLYDQKAIDMLRDDLEVLENMRDVLRESPEETFREDAARYRWMASCKCCPFSEADSAWESKDALDTAIDAAREGRDAPSR